MKLRFVRTINRNCGGVCLVLSFWQIATGSKSGSDAARWDRFIWRVTKISEHVKLLSKRFGRTFSTAKICRKEKRLRGLNARRVRRLRFVTRISLTLRISAKPET